jgi:iron complex outermembrane recepter protein
MVLSRTLIAAGMLSVGAWLPAIAAEENAAADDLTRMSLADLSKVEVTSVSKSSEVLQRAPAAVYVITHDDIARAGVTSIPEALRLAPNLLVTQTTSSAYVISARGFGGNPTAQNFSNKLLILIDGRSVYTPLFSGIYADTIDVMLEDVDRIEVISGVGATLWGANAMNGVINIITRPSDLTQGTVLDAGAGNQEQIAGGRYGGRINGEATFRLYGFEFHRGALQEDGRSSARDGWSKGQGGFRSDWSFDRNNFTIQGDFYRGTENQPGVAADVAVTGGNVVTRYQHHGDLSDFQAQAFYDMSERTTPLDGSGFVVHTFDLEIQQTLTTGSRNHLIWGAGERISSYAIANSASLLFEPARRVLSLGNAFLQDTVSVKPNVDFIVGLKFEDDPFWGWTPLPEARVSWVINDQVAFWGAASRAIRSPTPFDDEVVEKVGTTNFLVANGQFRPEKVTAYEMGLRAQPSAVLSLSVAPFYNVYDDLRTVDPATASTFLPLYWGNALRGDTYGVDAWSNWQVAEWWRLSPGVSWVRERLSFKHGAVPLLGVAQAADDPSSHVTIASSMNFPHRTSLDLNLRYVGALPSPELPHYYDLDARIAWIVRQGIELSVRGANLLHARHIEFPAPAGEQITRSVLAEARCRF